MLFLALRIILIVAAAALVVFLLHSIKKSKMAIEDALFWMLFSLLILVMAVFPQLPSFLSDWIGFQSPVNFVFLFFIFILIVRDFLSNRRISQLENRVKELTQQVAIDRLDHYERRELGERRQDGRE